MLKKNEISRISLGRFLDQAAYAAFLFIPFALMLSKPAPILIGVYLAIGCYLASRILLKLSILPKTGIGLPILFVLTTLVVSVAAGGDWHEGMRGLNKWIRAILIFWVSFHIFQSSQRENQIIKSFLIVFLIACFDGLYQYFSGYDLFFTHPVGFTNGDIVRVTSSFGYFGMFACFLMMLLPVVLICIKTKPKWSAQFIILCLMLVLGLINLYLTRSRGAWVALAGMCFLFLMLQKKKWAPILFVMLVGASLLFIPKDLIFHNRTKTGIDTTVNHRFVLWNQAINILKANPAFGCGLNTYVKNIEKYNSTDNCKVNCEVRNYYAHNGYLQHAAETGIFGLMAILLLFWRFFLLTVPNCFSRNRESFRQLMIMLSISGFLFYMIFDTIFHNLQPFVALWIFLGWGLAIQKRGIKNG